MRKLLTCLSMSAVVASPVFASTIDFSNQDFQTKYVDVSASGCNNSFGTSLQQDLDADPIIATVSAKYDLEPLSPTYNTGNAYVTAKSAHGQILSDTLSPLGVEGIYAFGAWHNPGVQATINGHSYSVYRVSFFTNGDSTSEWISNGNQIISFTNPDNTDYACPVYSRPQNTAATRQLTQI